jgi:uncharacterized protein (DUF849 family)
MAFPGVAQSYLLGGHVRVGLEDTIFIEKGVLARDNAALVEKLRALSAMSAERSLHPPMRAAFCRSLDREVRQTPRRRRTDVAKYHGCSDSSTWT